jgi:thioredoxin reductase
MGDRTRDVVVVGGGAAGLSAGLLLARARLRVTVVDAGRPRNAPAAHMHGFLSRDGMPPADLLAAGRAEVESYGGELLPGEVTGVTPGFEVRLADGQVLPARRILVTTGMRDELPDVPGVADRWGRDVMQCPYCHGYEVRDQPLAVLATSPASVHQALLVRQWSSDLLFFEHTYTPTDEERAQLTAWDVPVGPGRVEELVVDDDRLVGVRTAGQPEVTPRTAVFVFPRFVAGTGPLAALGCRTDERGFVVVDDVGATSVPGVWAAGNVTNSRAQVITAAGAGAAAAMAIHADLVHERTAIAVGAAARTGVAGR